MLFNHHRQTLHFHPPQGNPRFKGQRKSLREAVSIFSLCLLALVEMGIAILRSRVRSSEWVGHQSTNIVKLVVGNSLSQVFNFKQDF